MYMVTLIWPLTFADRLRENNMTATQQSDCTCRMAALSNLRIYT